MPFHSVLTPSLVMICEKASEGDATKKVKIQGREVGFTASQRFEHSFSLKVIYFFNSRNFDLCHTFCLLHPNIFFIHSSIQCLYPSSENRRKYSIKKMKNNEGLPKPLTNTLDF